ncbi:SMI1/KNR4 family protein [Aliiroseovarius sp. KMU-50]|uniref:SMI1/KNR4 family protein n=1 Tax=Aliiroseovarius salicola TaxID=3009082 RepID=A0ABT4W2G4_9RHOB|nr:SMI1/KNR4 family protein [Aliiroseovarius sp. KMU-50]MDA5094707.1 SMI1/KNR4 family protein [Aliiroseovarius sp. KMU-50]
MTNSISDIVLEMKSKIRGKLDPLGHVEGANGAIKTGHVPHVAPFAYLATFYAGLDDKGIELAEAESDRFIPEAYRAFLLQTNGMRLGELSLHGTTYSSACTSGPGIGQPISLVYQNVYERPEYVPAGHLGIGAVSGQRSSQGLLYLSSTGEVEMYHGDADLIGARWVSFEDFLQSEVLRQLSLYDAQGKLLTGVKHLPGKTDGWEALAEEADKERAYSDGI